VSLLEVHDVYKAYGGVRALDGCSMTFEEGKINGLIGPNGSGKTTLFNVMTGYEHADRGSVIFRDNEISKLSPNRIFDLGVGRTFQITRIFRDLSVIENIHTAIQRSGFWSDLGRWNNVPERERAAEVLELMGLIPLAHEAAGNLSYGQQKLLEFATILVAAPKVILLDEPAGGVNPSLLRQLTARIRAVNGEGVTFLIVEHDMEFVMKLCDRISVMNQGKSIAEGSPSEVRANPAVLEAYLGASTRKKS
jgi:ABC-type branched-subunit amino acid transport system ATPase component